MKTFKHYPTVIDAISLVCADNNIEIRCGLSETAIPNQWIADFDGAEHAALFMCDEPLNKILPDNDIEELEADGNEMALEAFATGECTLAEHLIARVPSADCLGRVLEAAFDGDLVRLVHA